MCPKRLTALATTALVCAALVAPRPAPAQTSMDLPDEALAGGGLGLPVQGGHARSIFLGTIAAMLAQGVGGALSQGIAGSITRWFQKPGEPQRAASATTPRVAGAAYEVHLIDAQGISRAVDPARHVFQTGDRFQVHYRAVLPGRMTVSNVDPRGRQSIIDHGEVAAGQIATLGPYRFVDAKGSETLKVRLEPCSTPALLAATRGIVKASGPAAPDSSAALRLRACGDVFTGAGTRSIAKASMDGATAFALDALGRDEVASGQVAAREFVIRLQHR